MVVVIDYEFYNYMIYILVLGRSLLLLSHDILKDITVRKTDEQYKRER